MEEEKKYEIELPGDVKEEILKGDFEERKYSTIETSDQVFSRYKSKRSKRPLELSAYSST